MWRTPLLLIVLGCAGCATLRGGNEYRRSYGFGLEALAQRDYIAATRHLEAASRSSDNELAARALLLLVTARLDPANVAADANAAEAAAARLRARAAPGSPDSVVAAALERLAVEFRELQAGLVSAGRRQDAALAAIDSLRPRLTTLTTERDAARRRIAQLEQDTANLSKELQKKTQELERIRRAIRG